MSIKILFVNAINPFVGGKGDYFSFGLGYLASSLRNYFGEDYFHFKIVVDNIEKELKNFKPDIVGISSVSKNYNIAKRHAKIARSREIPVIIGGVHISMLPQSLSEDMDVAVIGEGEWAIIDLLKLFIEKGGFPVNGLSKIKGIAFRNKSSPCLQGLDKGKLVFTEKRELIWPLDKIPFPARDLLKIEKNLTHIFSSRGCPYRCTFCASSRFWDKTRFFSAEYVVEEIKQLIDKYNVASQIK